MAKRIQLRRTKGWRKPEGVVVVARPTKWGNPWRVGVKYGGTVVDCVNYFRAWIEQTPEGKQLAEDAKRELRGKDLACWCKVGSPCHGDVLLELANETAVSEGGTTETGDEA